MNSEPLDEAEALVAEVMLGSGRGGRRKAEELEVSVVRVLTPDDLPKLLEPPPVPSTGVAHSTLQIRHSHHQLARLIAEGRGPVETGLLTGYSVAYISDLQNNPAFAELLAFYKEQKDLIFVDVLERMKVMGLNTLEEIERRLEAKPDDWTRRELMELAELMLLKSQAGAPKGQGTSGGAGVSINVKFVSADGAKAAGMIDITPSEPG